MYENVVKALNARGFKCSFVESSAEAKALALELIGDKSVGFGGSRTVADLGIYESLQERGNSLHWHWKAPAEQKAAVQRLARDAEVYICSSNAILEDGRLFNIDGTGNRVACMVYGPPEVIVIAGVNKICPDYDSAITRIKRDCCPANARRQNLNTPCAITGVCGDCKTKARMCNVTTILEYPTRVVKSFHVILVNEKLGV